MSDEITRADLTNLEQKVLAERRARKELTPTHATTLKLIDHFREMKGWQEDAEPRGGD